MKKTVWIVSYLNSRIRFFMRKKAKSYSFSRFFASCTLFDSYEEAYRAWKNCDLCNSNLSIFSITVNLPEYL